MIPESVRDRVATDLATERLNELGLVLVCLRTDVRPDSAGGETRETPFISGDGEGRLEEPK
jgi:hypothetical protein